MRNTAAAVVALLVSAAPHVSAFVVGGNALARARQGLSATPPTGCAPVYSMKLAQVPFSKYQGLGNDFILVDNRHAEEPMLTAEESANLCDRWGRLLLESDQAIYSK